MDNVAESFANDNVPAARESFARATLALERWEKLAGETPEFARAGMAYRNVRGHQTFETPIGHQELQPPRPLKNRKFNVLSPRYRFEARLRHPETIINPGHRMHRAPSNGELDAHAEYKEYALQCILKLMKSSPRGLQVFLNILRMEFRAYADGKDFLRKFVGHLNSGGLLRRT